jgi:predicted DNA-binding protein with PD1-like motif
MLKGQIGRICFSRIFEGEDLAEAVKKRVEESGVKAGIFILIGSLKNVIIGYYKEGLYARRIGWSIGNCFMHGEHSS